MEIVIKKFVKIVLKFISEIFLLFQDKVEIMDFEVKIVIEQTEIVMIVEEIYMILQLHLVKIYHQMNFQKHKNIQIKQIYV